VPPPLEEEEDEVVDAPVLPVDEYQPPDLSEEEALRRPIEESELIELDNWVGLGAHLAASASTSSAGASMSRASPPPPPPPPPAADPSPGATPSGIRCLARPPFR
jgi:hypothetical protein